MRKAVLMLVCILCLCGSAAADETVLPYKNVETSESFLFLPSFMEARPQEGITVMKSANLPSLFIDTASGDMETVHSDKDFHEPANLRMYDVNGALLLSDNLEYVKGHGNATWSAEKKSYQIKFNNKTNLFQMGKAKKWLLIANARDGSFLRNKILYDAALGLGIPYAIESQFVDVYLNGNYAGNYLLTEKVEEGSARVALPQDSYLVEIENHPDSGDIHFETEWGTLFRLHYPEDGGTAFVQQKAQELENAFIDMEGYMDLIVPETFARKAILDEISKNNDGFEGSTFFYLTKENGWRFNGDLYWDYDSTFGNWDYRYGYYKDPMGLILPDLSIWYETLYMDADFRVLMAQQYLRAKPLFEQYVESGIDEWVDFLSASAAMDDVRYQGREHFTKAPDLIGQAEALKAFLAARLTFLDSAILDGVEYVKVFLGKGEADSRYVFVPSGTLLGDIEPGTKWCFDGSEEPLPDDLALTFSCMVSEIE